MYQLRKQGLRMLEEQSGKGHIDLFYGDQSQVSPAGYVPYGWQFPHEQVSLPAAMGRGLSCFALVSRCNRIHYKTSQGTITADFVVEQLSLTIKKPTVVVLDNARVHTAAKVKERLKAWEYRGLFVFCLPVYSPHLNLAERLWKELKGRWLRPQDYVSNDSLVYAVNLALAAVGSQLFVNF